MSPENTGGSRPSSGITIVPNAEQAKSAVSWFVTTFGAGIAGFVAGKGWASTQTVMALLNSPEFMNAAIWMVLTLPTLVWGLYVHTKRYATEVVDAIPEVKGVITDRTPAGIALAKAIPSDTVVAAGTVQAAQVSSAAPVAPMPPPAAPPPLAADSCRPGQG
jgi:hypothetical protein